MNHSNVRVDWGSVVARPQGGSLIRLRVWAEMRVARAASRSEARTVSRSDGTRRLRASPGTFVDVRKRDFHIDRARFEDVLRRCQHEGAPVFAASKDRDFH